MTRSAGTVSCFSLAGSQLSVGSQALEMWGLSSHPADNKPMLGGHSTVITLAHSQLQECYFLICPVYIYIYAYSACARLKHVAAVLPDAAREVSENHDSSFQIPWWYKNVLVHLCSPTNGAQIWQGPAFF